MRRTTQRQKSGSLAVLAILEHEAPEKRDGWTAMEISELIGRARKTIYCQLEQLYGYRQVDYKEAPRIVPVSDSRRDRPRSIEVRTKLWFATDRGSGRLKYKGGHRGRCTVCAPATVRRKR